MTRADRPNVLIVTTHDSGRHFGCYGAPTVRTPNIDRLAADGVLFERVFAACPICSPSRGALLTGREPLSNGLVGLAGGSWNWELNDYRQHLSHRLHDAGYHTVMFGLQHETEFIERMGFDDTSAHGVCPKDPPARKSAEAVAADVAAFLAQQRDADPPFYAQVGFFETHTPYDFAGCEADEANGVWIPPYAKCHGWPSWAHTLNRFHRNPEFARRHVAELQGSLRCADTAVGCILDALAANGLEQNTIVLFNTDHGPELPGAKWTMYDAGLGIAFILRWPAGGVSGGRRCDWLLGNVDFLPTLFELLGLPQPDDLQGVSFAAACTGDAAGRASPREVVFGNWVDGLNFSARTERFKLIRNLVPTDSTGRVCPEYELYDLHLDPLEVTNVVSEPAYADAFRTMQAHLDRWLRDREDPTSRGPVPSGAHEDMLAAYRERYEHHAATRSAGSEQ